MIESIDAIYSDIDIAISTFQNEYIICAPQPKIGEGGEKEVYMKCSQCSSADTKVIESRDVSEGEAIRRRRACPDCGYRFTTYERIERPQIIVIKNNGTRELFNRDKLLAGLVSGV